MNGQSLCREPLDNGRRCGRLYGHNGECWCCTLHAKQQAYADQRYQS